MGIIGRFLFVLMVPTLCASSISGMRWGGGIPSILPPAPSGGNLAPAFSYVQPGLSPDAKRIMAKWAQKMSSVGSEVDKIKATKREVNQDRSVLSAEDQRRDLAPGDHNAVEQHLLVLDYAEVVLMVKGLGPLERQFSIDYTDFLEKKPSQGGLRSQGTSKTPEWYTQQAGRLGSLLTRLHTFLQANPEYYENPPPLLPQLATTLGRASTALGKYQQFQTCLTTDPNAPFCIALGASAQQNSRDSRYGGGGGDDEYDDGFSYNDEFEPGYSQYAYDR